MDSVSTAVSASSLELVGEWFLLVALFLPFAFEFSSGFSGTSFHLKYPFSMARLSSSSVVWGARDFLMEDT